MMDDRARHLRRMRRQRRAARRWSVVAGGLAGGAAILTPYAGIGLADAFWVAAAAGSAVLAGWRWVDYRALAAQPVPAPAPTAATDRALPGGREVVAVLRRQADRFRLRGSVVAPGLRRLDRASAVFSSLALRPGGPGETAMTEAVAAESGLRELARRTAGVERGLAYVGSDGSADPALSALVAQFNQGVTAYEELVGAAAAYVAEDGRTTPQHPSVSRLAEATDLLRGIALGLAELRQDSRLTA